jgi:hypothetical protein
VEGRQVCDAVAMVRREVGDGSIGSSGPVGWTNEMHYKL